MVAISGTAGIGKSTCAIEVARRFYAACADQSVLVWLLNAETEDAIHQDYIRLLQKLDPRFKLEKDLPTHEIAQLAADALQSKMGSSRWLLVFDNVPDDAPGQFAEWFFPSTRGLGVGRFLFTTRSNRLEGDVLRVGEGDIKLLQLPTLGEEDGAQILLQDHKQVSTREREAAEKLSVRLEGLPLLLRAVRKEAKSRFGRTCPLSKYLDDDEKRGIASQTLEEKVDQVLRRSFDLVLAKDGRDSPAYRLLSVLGCIAPTQLPHRFLCHCADGDEAAVRRLVDIGILQEAGDLGS
eukprot:scaffold1656_cov153-Pinguiococcus_pyrenoidosus.AAC.1